MPLASLSVDDLLGLLVERIGFEAAHVFEVVAVVGVALGGLGSKAAASSSSSDFHHRSKKSVRFWTLVSVCCIRLR